MWRGGRGGDGGGGGRARRSIVLIGFKHLDGGDLLRGSNARRRLLHQHHLKVVKRSRRLFTASDVEGRQIGDDKLNYHSYSSVRLEAHIQRPL